MELSRYNTKRFLILLGLFFVLQAAVLVAVSHHFSGNQIGAVSAVSVGNAPACTNCSVTMR